jgi:PAS domain S-box-containing protein
MTFKKQYKLPNGKSTIAEKVASFSRIIPGKHLTREEAKQHQAEAEKALHESEEQLRLIIDSLPVLIAYVDAKERYQFNNAAYEQWWGIPHFELKGKYIWEVVGDKAYAAAKSYIQQALQGQTVSYETEIFDHENVRKYISAVYVPHFVDGKVAGFHTLVTDITSKYKLDQRLKLQNAINHILAESASLEQAFSKTLEAICKVANWDVGIIWCLNKEKNILVAKEIWSDLSFNAPEFVKLTRQMEFAPNVGLPGRILAEQKITRIPELTQDDSFLRNKVAASEGLRDAIGFPIQLGEEVLGVIEFYSHESHAPGQEFLDLMTAVGYKLGQYIQRKKAEEEVLRLNQNLQQYTADLEKSNKELEEFAYIASHDLQEPLRVVSGYVQLLSRRYKGRLDEKGDEFINFIIGGIERMQKLIQNLLMYSRLQAEGKVLKSVDMNQICEQVTANLQVSIKEKNADVTCEP